MFNLVLAAFVEARLLVLGEERGQVTVEVAHEALIRKWERLRQWVDADRDKLAELQELDRWVAQWQSYGTLLRGAQLGYAARVLEKYADDVSPDGKRMIAASQQAEEQVRQHELDLARERADEQARAARRLRIAAMFLAGALLAALGAGGVALLESWQATAAKEQANRKASEAEVNAKTAKHRLVSLYEEQGRQDLLRDDLLRAVVHLNQAYLEGARLRPPVISWRQPRRRR